MVERHGGEVPGTPEELLALPGVGAYTAAAVSCFAFGIPEVVVDTNVRRVLARTLEGKAFPHLDPQPRRGRARGRVDAGRPRERPNTWNVAVMELGALVCVARGPRCDECPVADLCAWNVAGRPAYDGSAAAGAGLARHRPAGARRAAAPAARRARGRCRCSASKTRPTTRRRSCAASTPSSPTVSSNPCPASGSASPPDPPPLEWRRPLDTVREAALRRRALRRHSSERSSTAGGKAVRAHMVRVRGCRGRTATSMAMHHALGVGARLAVADGIPPLGVGDRGRRRRAMRAAPWSESQWRPSTWHSTARAADEGVARLAAACGS